MLQDAQADRYRWLQRVLEIVPGLTSWAIILGPIWLSFSYPWLVAYFVLTFDFYILCRSVWLGVTILIGWRRVSRVVATDWRERLALVDRGDPAGFADVGTGGGDRDPPVGGAPKSEELIQLALIPTYTEPLEKLRETVRALAVAD
jgi:hypothetical protein